MNFKSHTAPHVFQCLRLWGFLVCLCCFVSSAIAQDYVLSAEDVVSVTVLGHPELSVEQITISATGKINLPVAGEVMASGKTVRQTAQEIAKRLNKRLVDPEVTVALKQARELRVSLMGAVTKGGAYPFKPGWRVTEALAAAGGLTGRPDETSVLLARGSEAPIPVDIEAALADPTSENNRRLQPNDILILTALNPKKVTVGGDVTQPNVYELRRAPRLLDALNAAGGLKQPVRNSRGYVQRKGQRLDVNLSGAYELRDPALNLELEPDDLVMVEAVPNLRISVDGRVKNAGNFELEPGSGVIQAIAQAGGLTHEREDVVAVVRRGQQNIPVDLEKAALEPGADVELRTNDVVLLNEPQIIRVQVTGQVNKPGPLRLTPGTRLQDALAEAGGPNGVRPDAMRLSVLRTDAGGKQVSLDIDAEALLSRNDLAQNLVLQEGDLVSLSGVKTAIAYISGEVQRPGAYELQKGDGIPELIARAGGYNESAALSQVALQRNDQTQNVDVYGALKEGANRPDVTLQAGDFVVVPRNEARIMVMQAVQRPGTYLIPEKKTLTVTDAINLAGGPRDRASIKEVALLRPDPTAPKGVQTKIISLARISTGDLSQNVPLQSGDIIYVHEAKAKTSILGVLGSVIGTLTGLRYLGGG